MCDDVILKRQSKVKNLHDFLPRSNNNTPLVCCVNMVSSKLWKLYYATKIVSKCYVTKNAENNIQKPAIALFGGVKIFQDSSFLDGIFRVFGEHKA